MVIKNVYLSHLTVHEVPELTLQVLLFCTPSVCMVNLSEVSELILQLLIHAVECPSLNYLYVLLLLHQFWHLFCLSNKQTTNSE